MTVADDLATLRDPFAMPGAREEAADRVEAEIARLKEERDGSVFLRSLADASADTWRNRAEAAEAEVARLRDGLRQIADSTHDSRSVIRQRARALLAGEDTA